MTSMNSRNHIILEIAAIMLGFGLVNMIGANTALLLGAGAVAYVAMKEKVNPFNGKGRKR